mgnify:CR=1 FL=1
MIDETVPGSRRPTECNAENSGSIPPATTWKLRIAVAAVLEREAARELVAALLELDLDHAGERVAVTDVVGAGRDVDLGHRARVELPRRVDWPVTRSRLRDAVHHEHGLVRAAAAHVDLIGVGADARLLLQHVADGLHRQVPDLAGVDAADRRALLDLDQPPLGGHLDHLHGLDDDLLEREVDHRGLARGHHGGGLAAGAVAEELDLSS